VILAIRSPPKIGRGAISGGDISGTHRAQGKHRRSLFHRPGNPDQEVVPILSESAGVPVAAAHRGAIVVGVADELDIHIVTCLMCERLLNAKHTGLGANGQGGGRSTMSVLVCDALAAKGDGVADLDGVSVSHEKSPCLGVKLDLIPYYTRVESKGQADPVKRMSRVYSLQPHRVKLEDRSPKLDIIDIVAYRVGCGFQNLNHQPSTVRGERRVMSAIEDTHKIAHPELADYQRAMLYRLHSLKGLFAGSGKAPERPQVVEP